ncbi:MAG: Type 1 glutamine amidotransferase-like domain-containing protein [Thermoanaerobaculia bacterium]|nr:Type 1 glutamine amidotransferase-like domain-containing protein [Thermoanaerobaculia bacterium]
MSSAWKPVVCLADSRLLFDSSAAGRALAAVLRANLPPVGARAAYIGAANGDEPAFFSLFEAAMDRLGVAERSFVRADFSAADRAALARADLVLLAGGDPALAWRVFERTGLEAEIRARRDAGALLVGVSAGAVAMGWLVEHDRIGGAEPPLLSFRFVPGVVAAHEEAADWAPLRRLLRRAALPLPGYGIPAGGGLVYHPDGSLEPLGEPTLFLSPESTGPPCEALLVPSYVPETGSTRTS